MALKPQKRTHIQEINDFRKDNPDLLGGKADREIWQMFKNGHEGAFRFIYEEYIDQLFRYGYRLTGNREMIKDTIQDLFIELRNSRNLSDTDCIRFYLLKALRFKIVHALKKQDRKNWLLREYDFFNFKIEVSHEVKILNRQLEEENKERLKRALLKLNDKQREAIYYFYYENLNYAQVASIMGFTNVKSARNLIYKSLDFIRRNFKGR